MQFYFRMSTLRTNRGDTLSKHPKFLHYYQKARADNPSFVDIVASPDEIELWGVVTYAIHKDTAPTRKLPRRVK